MVGKVTYKITGAKEIEEGLKNLGPRVARRGGDKAVLAAARIIRDEAKRIVPVRTGDLKRNIVAVLSAKGRASNQRQAVVGVRPPISRRAHFTEFGTVKSAAHPYLRPALDSQQALALRKMIHILSLELEKKGQGIDAFYDVVTESISLIED